MRRNRKSLEAGVLRMCKKLNGQVDQFNWWFQISSDVLLMGGWLELLSA